MMTDRARLAAASRNVLLYERGRLQLLVFSGEEFAVDAVSGERLSGNALFGEVVLDEGSLGEISSGDA